MNLSKKIEALNIVNLWKPTAARSLLQGLEQIVKQSCTVWVETAEYN